MKRVLILLISGIACAETQAQDDDAVVYRDFGGTMLWFEKVSDPHNMKLCSGHSCIRLLETPLVCDDDEFYCLNSLAIRFSIPKDLENRMPDIVTKDFGEENAWYHNGMWHRAVPWGLMRVTYNKSQYFRDAEYWGSIARAILIYSYEPDSDRPLSKVVYSPEWGILAIAGTYVDSDGYETFETYFAESKCGYLATHADCKRPAH